MRKDVKFVSCLRKWGAGESINIQKPGWKTPGFALLLLVGLCLIGEFIFRIDVVQMALTGPRIGGRHGQMENQFARLEKLVKEGEQIDCIFLGNSMVWLGINPLVVDEVFQSRTGQEIHCFTFGVSALPASSAGLIASVLVEKYHPKLLIYGTFARDYAIPAKAEDATVVSKTPWLQYQNGEFNFEGWLYTHSYLFKYKDHVRSLLLLNFEEVIPQYKGLPLYREYGFEPKLNIRIDVLEPPDLEEAVNRDPRRWLYHYEILEENIEGLRQVMRQSEHGVEVIVIEMPLHDTALDFFLNGKQDYEKYIHQVDEITALSKTPFWRTKDQPEIPKEGWWDYFHLNIHGAQPFSEWLANELSEAYLQGNFEDSLFPVE